MSNAATFKPLTNRSTSKGAAGKFALPEDGFVQLVPKGEAPNFLGEGKDAKRIIQVVDDEALTSIMHKLLNRAGDEMLIDDEHHSHDADKSTDANGWQLLNKDSLIIRDDGLYGSPRWSTLGEQKLTGGVKRFISPEFPPASIVHLGGNRYRVTELSGLALTNRPGFKRLQKPLTNRDADYGIDTATTHTMHKALLAAHLGISESDIDKLDEATLKNRLSEVKTRAAQADTLKGEIDAIKNREVDKFMSDHDKVIPSEPKVREHLKQTFLANRETAEFIVAGFTAGQKADGLTDEQRARAQKKPLHNRESSQPPEGDEALKNREVTRAAQIRNRATELCDSARTSGRNLPWNDAWSQAESEFPAA